MRIHGTVEPMLARAVYRLPAPQECGGGCRYEPKLDGYRCIAMVDDHRSVSLYSRHGTRFNEAFPEIMDAVFEALPAGTVADGELVRWSGDRLDFAALQRRSVAGWDRAWDLARAEPCHLVVFDLLETSGVDLRPRPLFYRRSILEDMMAVVPGAFPLTLSMHTAEFAEAELWLAVLPAHGIEGAMVKAAAEPYASGKRRWLKVKAHDTVEAIIGGVTGSLKGPQQLILGRYEPGGHLRIVGHTFKLPPAAQAELAAVLTRAGANHPWPERLAMTWGRAPEPYVRVTPLIVVEITVDTAIDQGRWRHAARYVRIRPDLSPADIPEPP